MKPQLLFTLRLGFVLALLLLATAGLGQAQELQPEVSSSHKLRWAAPSPIKGNSRKMAAPSTTPAISSFLSTTPAAAGRKSPAPRP